MQRGLMRISELGRGMMLGGGIIWYPHTLTLQPSGLAALDAYVQENAPDANLPRQSAISVGELNLAANRIRRIFIKFDLSTIPDNARITSTTLSLYLIANYSDNDRAFRVYRVKRNWVIDQITYNIYATGNAWQAAGGFGVNDCEQTSIGSLTLVAAEGLNVMKNWSLTPTTKAALDLGNGWMIKADTELNDGHQFAGSGAIVGAQRPKLVVNYNSTTP